MIYFILALLIIFCITTRNDNFTVKCDRCGSTDVMATNNGLKCHNCGAECKN